MNAQDQTGREKTAPDQAAPDQICVIIDTDPGLDDALALFLAFRSPELHVLGVVTVAGNLGIDTVTRNARGIMRLLGRDDVPVVRGAASPLHREPFHAPGIHGEDGLGGISFPEPAAAEHPSAAQDWLAETIKSLPAGTIRHAHSGAADQCRPADRGASRHGEAAGRHHRDGRRGARPGQCH